MIEDYGQVVGPVPNTELLSGLCVQGAKANLQDGG